MKAGAPLDAVVVGSGPNGLAAAITVARAGGSVALLEGAPDLGGGCRSQELTLPGFLHDTCAAVYPLGFASPFFRQLPLHRHGLRWIHPPAALAHPFVDGTAAVIETPAPDATTPWESYQADWERSLAAAGGTLEPDGRAWISLFRPLTERWLELERDLLGPLPFGSRHPLVLGRFGLRGVRSAAGLANAFFRGSKAPALFAGLAAHGGLPLQRAGSAAFGLVLSTLAHRSGWPIPEGGARRVSDALAAQLRELGGEARTGLWIETLDQLPEARTVLLDVSPRQLISMASETKPDSGKRLPRRYLRRLARFRHGPGVFKMDFALSGPIPWTAKACARAGTVHLGGTMEAIARAEDQVWRGQEPERPFVLLAQPTLFDGTRAPEGGHVAWAYCHVPHGSTADLSRAIEAQIERFAPGFRDLVLARHTRTAVAMEEHNPNLVGGDITGGVHDLAQLFARPVLRPTPYATPARGLYLCSASTPPGGGVHGMCGYHAAMAALRSLS